MRNFGILCVIFGIIVIAFPAILVFLIGGIFIVLGLNLIIFFRKINKKSGDKEDYIKFGNYKIYR